MRKERGSWMKRKLRSYTKNRMSTFSSIRLLCVCVMFFIIRCSSQYNHWIEECHRSGKYSMELVCLTFGDRWGLRVRYDKEFQPPTTFDPTIDEHFPSRSNRMCVRFRTCAVLLMNRVIAFQGTEYREIIFFLCDCYSEVTANEQKMDTVHAV